MGGLGRHTKECHRRVANLGFCFAGVSARPGHPHAGGRRSPLNRPVKLSFRQSGVGCINCSLGKAGRSRFKDGGTRDIHPFSRVFARFLRYRRRRVVQFRLVPYFPAGVVFRTFFAAWAGVCQAGEAFHRACEARELRGALCLYRAAFWWEPGTCSAGVSPFIYVRPRYSGSNAGRLKGLRTTNP